MLELTPIQLETLRIVRLDVPPDLNPNQLPDLALLYPDVMYFPQVSYPNTRYIADKYSLSHPKFKFIAEDGQPSGTLVLSKWPLDKFPAAITKQDWQFEMPQLAEIPKLSEKIDSAHVFDVQGFIITIAHLNHPSTVK